MPFLGSLSPISGSTSFYVAEGHAVLFRLQRPPGTTAAHVRLRSVFGSYGKSHSIPLRAGVVGGTLRQVAFTTPWTIEAPLSETVVTEFTGALPVEDVAIPLTEAGDEVILEIDGVCETGVSAPYTVAAWVDSITIR